MAWSTRRRLDGEHAEAAEQARVALLHLARAVERRRREEAHLAAREQRLQQVAHAAPGGALPEQRVDAADVEDGVSRAPAACDRGEHLPQPLLDLAAQLRARRRAAPVSSSRMLELGEALGHVARGDAHRERADDGRLADAGLADEQRVVLVPPLEDLQQPAHLDVAPDDRVEAAAARALDEVVREAREHVARRRAPRRGRPRAARS